VKISFDGSNFSDFAHDCRGFLLSFSACQRRASPFFPSSHCFGGGALVVYPISVKNNLDSLNMRRSLALALL
jgi:hypothetical protein